MNVFVLGLFEPEESFPCCLVPQVLAANGLRLTEFNEAELLLSVNHEGQLFNVGAVLPHFQSN